MLERRQRHQAKQRHQARQIACVVATYAASFPGLAHASEASRMVHLLSSRGFWFAMTIGLGGLYSIWNTRRRRKTLDQLMQKRALSKVPAETEGESAGAGWLRARAAIEQELGCNLPHLRQQDAMRSLMKWGEIRSLIGRLEEELEIELPDTKRVLDLTVGEFADLLRRSVERRAR